MPKWKKDAKEFEVGANFNERRGWQSSIPKPIMEALGVSEDNDSVRVRFVIRGRRIELEPAGAEVKNQN
jgi:hypothetical protein